MEIKTVEISTRVWNLLIKAFILIVVGFLVGFMISFFSPQATLTMGYGERIEFWVLLCLVGGAGMFFCDLILMFLHSKLLGWQKVTLQSICGTIAVLIPLYAIYDPSEIPHPSTTVLFVWIVMLLILAGATILGSKFIETDTRNDVEIVAEKPHANRPARILARLPIHLQSSELYALSAEDHYVRVHTSKGDKIILMRFSDAILETGDVAGLQIHRSWWVAQAAIDQIKTKGRSAEITLKNMHKAPVSRNALKLVRSMGWL
jgi:hypothetical protein